MKPKHFLLTLLALTTSAATFADVPEGNITFEDSAVKAILVANYDTNSDGEISYAEAAAVTSMVSFYNKSSITSFNEFQYFTGITSIRSDMFAGCSSLTSINIPNGVTAIKSGAFNGCSSLTSINIPNGVTAIEQYAFQNCSSLTSITLPDGVTSIGPYAFALCYSLISITIPDGVTSIDQYAFYTCVELTSITLPDGVTSIGNSAFSTCVKLTSINIPDGVTSIGGGAFYGCSSLTSINIPDGVTSIESSAFYGCSGLTSITIPNGVTSIGGYAFSGCRGIASINIPASVTSIGSSTFGSHNMIVNMASTTPCSQSGLGESVKIVVPTSAVEAYREAWSDIANVIVDPDHIEKEVTVTAKETSSAVAEEVGENLLINVLRLKVHGTINSYDLMVFRNKMINLLELDLSDANVVGNSYCYYTSYSSKDNVITGYFIPTRIKDFKLPKDITALEDYAFYECSYLKTITLPEGIASIPGYCFYKCSGLSDITIPESVTSIGGNAFAYCTDLTSMILPDGVTSIGSDAFYNCSNLPYIYFPLHLQTISGGSLFNSTFGNCQFTEIHLPPDLTSIGDNAFRNCSRLKTIYAYMPNIISIGANTFNDYAHQNLYVPDFLYDQYYYDTNWSQFLSVNRTTLRPDDYKFLATNSDNRWKPGDQRPPDKSDGNHINGEVQTQGSFTVEGETPLQFNELDQILDGEGKGGSLIGEDDGEEEGNLTANTLRVKINVKAGRWYFFCFPYDVTIANCTYPGQYAWRWYDGAERATNGSGGWKAVAGSTLTARQGYAFQTSHTGNLIITFSHPAFGGDRPKTLVAHASANAANASWNLVGNPYTSFYDFLATDFDAPITVYNSNGTYSAYRPGDDDCHLQPFEAFFVQKPTEVDAINFQSARRESYNQGQAKKAASVKARLRAGITPERRLINLEMFCGDEQADRTRVVLNEKKSRNYELDCDASKFLSNEAKAQLYSIENGVQMAINERPQQGDIRLGYTAKKAGTLSISAPRMDMPMVLVDTQLGTTFDLSLGTYEFETAAGTFDNRFMLRMSGDATAINNMTAKTGVCIGTQDGGIAIGGAEGKTVNVYTTGGAQAAQHSGNGFVALSRGVYVVSVDGVTAKVRVR